MLSTGSESSALEQHHERNLVAQRQFGQSIALRVAAGADAARQCGEVLRTDHHRCPVDHSGACHDSVGRDVAADEGAELSERALVEKVLQPCAGVELALAPVLGQPFVAAHRPRALTPKTEILERLLPALLIRHAQFPS